MSAIAHHRRAAAPSQPLLRSLFRKLLSLRTRLTRIDAEELPPHLQRDLGLVDGRDLPPRDFR